jgi:dihydroxy-acid dehydratase
MSTKLESFPEYQRAISKVHICACGADYEHLDRPIIAVVNSWNEIVSGHAHLRELAQEVKKAITDAGGLPIEFNTIAICDGITQSHNGMKYVLASRDLIADSIETMIESHGMFDGMVMLGSCDKIVPAMLMAAARLNIPAALVTGGPMEHKIPPSENKAARQKFISKEIDEKELIGISSQYYTSVGICPFLGTANTMCIVAEALGMSLPGSSTLTALSDVQMKSAYDTGMAVMNLVAKNIRPRDIMTQEAFDNALTVALAIGGSLNTVLHMPAIAEEVGLSVSLADFDRISKKTPFIVKVYPNSSQFAVADLYPVGGTRTIMNELSSLLHTDVLTVNGHTLKENLEGAKPADGKIISSFADPFASEGGIAVLEGNLAPEGAVVKSSAVPTELWEFSGPARVFESEEECIQGAYDKKILPGDAVIIRYEGPMGGPGMREMHRATEILGKIPNIAIITDGRFSGASAGLSVGYLSPEAYVGGAIGLIQNGDRIKISIPERKIEWCVDEDIIRQRHAAFSPLEKEVKSKFLRLYRKTVNSAAKGATRREI